MLHQEQVQSLLPELPHMKEVPISTLFHMELVLSVQIIAILTGH
jgi:hypothetical protein